MSTATMVTGAVRDVRRVRSFTRTWGVNVSGTAPTAVVEALRATIRQRLDKGERAHIERIERLRQLLLVSPHEFDMHETGDPAPHLPAIRSIAHMAGASKSATPACLLMMIIRRLRPESALELGSCVGISAAYQAAGLELNGKGRLVTLEGVVGLADRTRRSLEEIDLTRRVSVRQGLFKDTLDRALSDLGVLQYAFIDGHHQEAPTLDYMDRILRYADEESVLVFDDITWSDGMKRAWQTISADPRFALTVQFRGLGIAVISASARTREHLDIGFC